MPIALRTVKPHLLPFPVLNFTVMPQRPIRVIVGLWDVQLGLGSYSCHC